MKVVPVDAKLVIEYNSYFRDEEKRYKDLTYELKNLERELRGHRYLEGFYHNVETTYEYECEACHKRHEQKNLITTCTSCGKEVCDWCMYEIDDDTRLCQDCIDIREAAEEAIKDLSEIDLDKLVHPCYNEEKEGQ